MTGQFRKIEIVGTSHKSYEDAIVNAVKEVNSARDELKWFEVVELRGSVEDNGDIQYQAVLKIAYKRVK